MSDTLYKEKILSHYRNPRHYGKQENPSITATEENQSCGDAITVYITINDNTIENASFTGTGCAISIASTSMLMESITGMGVNQCNQLEKDDITDLLGIEVTPMRMKCLLLSIQTVQTALQQHEQNRS